MNEPKFISPTDAHKYFAVEMFNQSWAYLTKSPRTAEDAEKALQCAYGSTYHWSFVGEPLNQQRGEWMISHVSALLKRPQQALHHAERCLQLTTELGVKDFDLAYAYEGMARAYACAGNAQSALEFRKKAVDAGNQIAKPEDAEWFWKDLNDDNWFGIPKE